MTKFFYFRKGLLVASLVFAVTFMMAVSVKADMLLDSVEGTHTNSFDSGWIVGNGYTYSERFTLTDPNWFFTSFTLNPEEVNMFILSIITNGNHSMPGIDLNGTYNGLAKWIGQIVIKSGDDVLYSTDPTSFSKTIGGITYNPGEIVGNRAGYAESDWIGVTFTDLPDLGINLGADELAGVREIEFDFIMSELSFDNTDFVNFENAGNGEYWEGTIGGSVSMTYDTSSSSPEPATMLIFGLGIAGAGVVAQRKCKGKK